MTDHRISWDDALSCQPLLRLAGADFLPPRLIGTKERRFAPLINVSVEELVPQDHFYRHLEQTLDLSFVREFVQETYACKGRPSIDPVVSCFLARIIIT